MTTFQDRDASTIAAVVAASMGLPTYTISNSTALDAYELRTRIAALRARVGPTPVKRKVKSADVRKRRVANKAARKARRRTA